MSDALDQALALRESDPAAIDDARLLALAEQAAPALPGSGDVEAASDAVQGVAAALGTAAFERLSETFDVLPDAAIAAVRSELADPMPDRGQALSEHELDALDGAAERALIRKWGREAARKKLGRAKARIARIMDRTAYRHGDLAAAEALREWGESLDVSSATAVLEMLAADAPAPIVVERGGTLEEQLDALIERPDYASLQVQRQAHRIAEKIAGRNDARREKLRDMQAELDALMERADYYTVAVQQRALRLATAIAEL